MLRSREGGEQPIESGIRPRGAQDLSQRTKPAGLGGGALPVVIAPPESDVDRLLRP
jgi:hypothetical protein